MLQTIFIFVVVANILKETNCSIANSEPKKKKCRAKNEFIYLKTNNGSKSNNLQ